MSEEERELSRLKAERLLELGRIEADESRYPEANRCFREALEISQSIGDGTGVGRVLGHLGLICRVQGDNAQALVYYNQALEVAREIGDKRGEGSRLGLIGSVYRSQGEYDQAISYLTQAIELAQ